MIPKGFKKAKVPKFSTEMVDTKENLVKGDFLKIVNGIAYHCEFSEATHYAEYMKDDSVFAVRINK